MPSWSRRTGVLLLVLAAVCLSSSGMLDAATVSLRGRRLADVLEGLRARGLNLIYSSAVVTDELEVPLEPKSHEPRALLDEILAPLGLVARDGAGGAVLILRAEEPAPAVEAGPPVSRLVERVEVTPDESKLVQEDPSARRSIPHDELMLAPSVGGDVSRVAPLLPGVAAADNSAAFHVRGSDDRSLSIVLDGLELYEPFHLSGFQSPFTFVDSEIVDTVDLLSGGFTADRGDRNGGFLELSTTPPDPARSTRIDVGTVNTRISTLQPLARGALLVSGRSWYPEAVHDTIELGKDGLHPSLNDAYVKYVVQVSPGTVLSAHALFGKDRVETSTHEGDEVVAAESRSGTLWLRTQTSWSKDIYSETVVSAGRVDQGRHGISRSGAAPVLVDDERNVDFFGVKTDASWALGARQLLRGGLEARPLEAHYAYASGAPTTPATQRLDPSGTSLAGYVTDRIALSPRFEMELGLRWDWQSYTEGRQLSPRWNAIWKPGERSELRVGLGRFFQSQRIHELQIEDGQTSFLPAELSSQVEATFLQRLAGGMEIRLDAYARRLTHVQPRYENLFDPVEMLPETEPDRVLVAPERADLRGLELTLGGDPGQAFIWSTSYAWSSAMDRIDGEEVPRAWDQTHAGKVLLGYRGATGWAASLTGAIHTGWPTTPVDGDGVPGARNSARFPTYARADVGVSRTFNVSSGSIRFELQVANVTDRKNVCCVEGFDSEPRPDGGVETRPEYEYWLGITPSFQVAWTF